jgi:Putative transposase, YhgA-like
METLRINYDYWWKRLTTEFTPEFIEFFFSIQLYNLIDWTHPPEYLEQELTAAFTDSKAKKKIADKLIRLRLKNGKTKFIFVHVEFQGKSGKAFLLRMFWYYVYIMSRYLTTDITTVVIYTGDDVTKVYDRFEVKHFGTIMTYIFNTYVVSKQSEADLMASNNPMAIAVLANLYVNQTRTELEKRAEYKKKLFELAKLKGYDAEKTERLLTFVYYLMQLPKGMEVEMKAIRRKNKKEPIMATTTLKPPRIKGFKETQRNIRNYVFEAKFGMSYDEFIEKAQNTLTERFMENTMVMAAEQAKVMAAEQAKVMAAEQAKVMAAEQAKVMAAEQAKVMAAEQAKVMAAEQVKVMAAEQAKVIAESITTMYKKTGWSAEKIADISGFSLDTVRKVVDKFK